MRTTSFFLFSLIAGCGNDPGFSDGDSDMDVDSDSDSDSDGDTDTDTNDDACELVEAVGCPDGENCDTDMSGHHQCIDAGEGVQGDTCGTTADCGRGLWCNATEPGSVICQQWCEEGADTCPEGSVCSTIVNAPGTDPPVALGRLCAPTTECDVLTQTGCDGGAACYIVETPTGLTDCVAPDADSGGQGATCEFLNDCQAGFECEGGTCKQFCNDDGGDPQCPVDYVCTGSGMSTPAGVAIGYCDN
jgi:hypothetical protein